MKKALLALVVAAAALIAIFAMSQPAAARVVEGPACEATSEAEDATYGRVVDGVWTASALQPCVKCVGGQRPPDAPPFVPCC